MVSSNIFPVVLLLLCGSAVQAWLSTRPTHSLSLSLSPRALRERVCFRRPCLALPESLSPSLSFSPSTEDSETSTAASSSSSSPAPVRAERPEKRPPGWERFFEERHVVMRSFPPRRRPQIEPNTWRKNLPRKLKRRLKHADAERLASLLTPELDEYLKNDARGGIYDTLMKKLSHTARRTNMTLPEGFGLKPVKARPTVLQRLRDAGNFTTLLRVVELSQFEQTLNGSSAVTLFAPTDDAFAQLESGVLDAMLQEPAQLTRLLQHHTVAGFVNLRRLRERNGQSLAMGSNASLAIEAPKADAPVSLGGAPLNADILQPWECFRGLVHTIGKVLLPPPPEEETKIETHTQTQTQTEAQANDGAK